MLQLTDQNPDTTGNDIVHKGMLGMLGPACIHKLYAGAHLMYPGTADVDLSGSKCVTKASLLLITEGLYNAQMTLVCLLMVCTTSWCTQCMRVMQMQHATDLR